MSNLNIHPSQSGIPISTTPQKPLTQSSSGIETHPQPETVNKPPLSESGTQTPTLSHSETLESIETTHTTSQEMQQTSGQLSGLRQSLALSIGISEDGPLHPVPQQDEPSGEQPDVDKTPPPKYSGEQLQSKLGDHLRDNSEIQKFSKNLSSLEQTVDSVKHSESQLKAIDDTLEKTLQDLDKRKQAYNAPLYRLASKLGIKSRKTKLAKLEQLRSSALKSHEALTNLNKLLGEDGVKKLDKLPGKLQGNIQQARTDGQNLVKAHAHDQAMMWSLGTQSKSQLRETLAQSLISEMHGGQGLLDKYKELSQDHSTRLEAFQELKAQLTLYKNRVANFNKAIQGLEQTAPEEARSLKARFQAEKFEFEKSLLPLIEKTGIQSDKDNPKLELARFDDKGEFSFLDSNVLTSITSGGSRFPDAPPKLYDVLPEHHQQYIDAMASGIQETLPNKLLSEDSLVINGEKYSNKTKLAQMGMGVIYTYTSESDPTKKIAVKVPIKPDDMSEEEFQEKLETESSRELNTHYQAMGVNGNGHPNVVKMLGAISTDQGPLIAMEFVDKGDCSNFTGLKGKVAGRAKTGDVTPDEQRLVNKHVLYQMLEGMQHLHDRDITHMDVKPDQFMINSSGRVQVSDFGMSKTVGQFQAKLSDRGDGPIYLAPELMGGNLRPFAEGRSVSNKVDVWSMGVIAHQMLLGSETRLDAKFFNQIEKNVGEFGYDMNNRMFPQPQNETEVFLNKMLHPDPNQRPSCRELMQDPIFNELFAQGNGGSRGSYRQDVTDLVVRELNA